jgi:hypothetical protein
MNLNSATQNHLFYSPLVSVSQPGPVLGEHTSEGSAQPGVLTVTYTLGTVGLCPTAGLYQPLSSLQGLLSAYWRSSLGTMSLLLLHSSATSRVLFPVIQFLSK